MSVKVDQILYNIALWKEKCYIWVQIWKFSWLKFVALLGSMNLLSKPGAKFLLQDRELFFGNSGFFHVISLNYISTQRAQLKPALLVTAALFIHSRRRRTPSSYYQNCPRAKETKRGKWQSRSCIIPGSYADLTPG